MSMSNISMLRNKFKMFYSKNADNIFISGGVLGSVVGFYCGHKFYEYDLKENLHPTYDKSFVKYFIYTTLGATMAFLPGLILTPLVIYTIPAWSVSYFTYKKLITQVESETSETETTDVK